MPWVSLLSLHQSKSAGLHCCSLFYLHFVWGYNQTIGYEQRPKSTRAHSRSSPDLSPFFFFPVRYVGNSTLKNNPKDTQQIKKK